MKHGHAFIMMVREKYWIAYRDRHREGKEIHAYVTRGFASPRNTQVLFFYVSKPVKSLCGYASFIGREVGRAEKLWGRYSDESVLKSEMEFEEFIGTAGDVSFVRFCDLHEAVNPIPLRDLLMLFNVKKLSRKGFYVEKDIADELISMMK